MTAPAAMQADFVDLKFVKGRKVMQVILELPIEAGAAFVAAFGTPNPATGVPVAIARIGNITKIKPGSELVTGPDAFNAKPEKPKGGKLAQRAGILCNEGGFQKFVASKYDMPEHMGVNVTSDDAAEYVRRICGVSSRADLDHSNSGAQKFKDLEASYNAWLAAS